MVKKEVRKEDTIHRNLNPEPGAVAAFNRKRR
jgi:hypothetical protein